MEGHNFPDDDISNGIWGPEWGPNCPAWRTLSTEKIDELNKNLIFQGYSGMIYCTKKMKKRGKFHDGHCGPDNGSPCDSCLALIYDENDIEDIIEKISTPKVIKTITKSKTIRTWTIF